MSELLTSIKADLLDRRLLPLVALVAVGLVAALAYAVLGGSSSPSAPGPIASATPAVQTGGLQVSSTTADHSVAETTDGAKEQRSGKARNPFSPLPEKSTSTTTTAAASTPSSSSTEPSGGSSPTTPSGSSETTKTEPTKTEPTTKAKPKKAGYHVAVLFGLFPAGATPETVTLAPYENLKLQTPLPSARQALIVFRGVTAAGKSATFTLLGEAILHGNGACLPNPSQCQAIDLKPGQVEQFEYLGADGTITTYELRVVSITPAKASKTSGSASAASVTGWAESKAGRELLRHSGLFSLPFLRYSSQPGVLVFAPHRASSAHAHTAAQPRHDWH